MIQKLEKSLMKFHFQVELLHLLPAKKRLKDPVEIKTCTFLSSSSTCRWDFVIAGSLEAPAYINRSCAHNGKDYQTRCFCGTQKAIFAVQTRGNLMVRGAALQRAAGQIRVAD